MHFWSGHVAERHYRPDLDLVEQAADWGVTIAEARPRLGPRGIALILLGNLLLGAGAVFVLAPLAGVMLFKESDGILTEVTVVALILAVGVGFRMRSSRLPRNALQIDERAAEIRLGSQIPGGAFVRQKVASFRDIDDIRVETRGEDAVLAITTRGKILTVRFTDTDTRRLERLAARIAEARDAVRHAPIRSRIQSRIHGIDASLREVKTRIQSRIA
jgi:hypothetical protein